jgi:hypothetical protein
MVTTGAIKMKASNYDANMAKSWILRSARHGEPGRNAEGAANRPILTP